MGLCRLPQLVAMHSAPACDAGWPPNHPRRGSHRAVTTARGALQRTADRGSTGCTLDGARGEYAGARWRLIWHAAVAAACKGSGSGRSKHRGRVWKSAFTREPQSRKCCPRLWNRHVCSFCGFGVGRAVRTRKLVAADRGAGGVCWTRG
ncbi:hypothetical protein QTP88_008750 [Uroleucon formosanum]